MRIVLFDGDNYVVKFMTNNEIVRQIELPHYGCTGYNLSDNLFLVYSSIKAYVYNLESPSDGPIEYIEASPGYTISEAIIAHGGTVCVQEELSQPGHFVSQIWFSCQTGKIDTIVDTGRRRHVLIPWGRTAAIATVCGFDMCNIRVVRGSWLDEQFVRKGPFTTWAARVDSRTIWCENWLIDTETNKPTVAVGSYASCTSYGDVFSARSPEIPGFQRRDDLKDVIKDGYNVFERIEAPALLELAACVFGEEFPTV